MVGRGPGRPSHGGPRLPTRRLRTTSSTTTCRRGGEDNWGLIQIDGEPSADQLAALDALAAATSSGDVPLDQIQSFFRLDGFRVPPVVTSYSPASAVPLQVPSSREPAPAAPGAGL